MLHCPTCGQDFADEVRVCPEDGSPLQADPTVAIAKPVVDPLLGRTLDEKYRLDARLGTGGMGTVYRATHLLIDRPVAIKVLNSRYVEDEAAQVRFRREARAAGRLQHANAVTVTDFGSTSDGLVYIVMELLEGYTLRDVLAREAPLDVARAVSIMLQISSAVAAAHAAGIIHRDLKPANIFIVQRKDAPPFVKVLDFGIAKLAADALDDDDDPPVTLTQVGAMIGTPRYMSPEQCDGAHLTPAADVYSLGIILYEMLTGTTPFNGTSPLAIAIKHSSQPPRSPREFVGAIPAAIEEVVLHALEKAPEARPKDAEAFRQEIYEVAERLGLEHADSLSAPTIESLRSAGTETPSGRLVIDIERLRQSRAAATATTAQPEVVAQSSGSNLVEEVRPPENINPSQPAFAAAPPPYAVPMDMSRPAPAVSRMRIFFGKKQTWFRWLTRPIRILLISMMALLLLAVTIAVFATRTSGKLAAASDAGETLGGLALKDDSENPAADEDKESRQGARNARERRAGNRPAPPKKPSVFSRAKNKLKKIFKW